MEQCATTMFLIQITTWNALNPLFENESYYPKECIKHLHWNSGRKEKYLTSFFFFFRIYTIRVMSYVVNFSSHIFSIQEVSNEIASQITASLNKKHGNVYEFVWKQVKMTVVVLQVKTYFLRGNQELWMDARPYIEKIY